MQEVKNAQAIKVRGICFPDLRGEIEAERITATLFVADLDKIRKMVTDARCIFYLESNG